MRLPVRKKLSPAQRKKIVIVSDTIYPYFKGGKEQRIHHVSTRLARMGHDVHIYTMKWWPGPATIAEHGVHLHGIGKLRNVYKNETRRSMRVSLLFALSCLRLMRVSFDVIDVDHMPYLQLFTIWLVCKLRGKKMYATWHEVWDRPYWQTYLGRLGIVAYVVEYLAGFLPDYILANSEDTRTKLQLRYPRRAARIVAAYNGINIAEIDATQPTQSAYDVMYAGRLIKHKNVAMLIRAMAIVRQTHPQVRCVIVGDGPDRHNLELLRGRLGLESSVDFTGFLPEHSQVYGYMKTTALLVQPSRREGFGLVVIEANACGTPVLTLNHPDNAATSLIREGFNGYTFRTTAELAARITEQLDEPLTQPLQFTLEARKYDWHYVANTVAEAYAL